ncbi:MAG: hypothetical protein J6K72_08385 [Clostridia bacterium]|nr:hypothetical protein [Clostridia bacterium]
MAQYWITNEPVDIPFEECGEATARVVQNAKNLIMAKRGEVPYDRSRGFDPELFDLPLPELNERLLPELDRVMIWEPAVEVVKAEASIRDTGETLLRVLIEVEE